jgi:hypothetical protein
MSTLSGQGAIGFAGNTSDFYTTPFPHKPGDKGRDKDGNEYVFVDYTATVYFGCVVQITADYQAAPLLGTSLDPYRVGIACGGTATSDSGMTSNHGGWVQVYGMFYAAQTGSASGGLSSDQSVAYHVIPQASVGTPSGTFSLIAQGAGTSIAQSSIDANRIWGMWVVPGAQVSNLANAPSATVFGVSVSDTSGPSSVAFGVSTATSAFIGSTHVVFLNYPYVTGVVEPISDATS